MVGSPCSPRDSQESYPTPKFKGINSSALSFVYISTLTYIHDYWKNYSLYSVLFSSIVRLCPTLCDPMDCSTPGLPLHHQLLEFTKTHVHWVGDAIQPFHPLLSPSPTFNLSQHQGLSKKLVLRIRWPKYWSFSFSISPSNEYSWLISLQSKGLSRVFSNTTVQKH